MSEKKKEKKEKVVYIDDGHTIVDMTGIGGKKPKPQDSYTGGSSFKEKWKTYWSAVRMMLIPMAVVVSALLLLYLIMYFALK